MNKKKFIVSLLLFATLLSVTSMPSYAGLGELLAEHIVEHFIEDFGLDILDMFVSAGLVELEPYQGAYANKIMNQLDYKLHDSSLLVLPIIDTTNTSFGGVSSSRDFFNVMGRATVVNYSNLKVNPNTSQDITLRKSDVKGDIAYKGMNAGFINFGDIDLNGGTINLTGYDGTSTLSRTTNGKLNLNDLSTLTYENIFNVLDYNSTYPTKEHYISYFINSNQTQVDAVSPTPTKGIINDNVSVKGGAIFINAFDADIDRDDYRPSVHYLETEGSGNVIYNSGDMSLVRVNGQDSVLINDKSHITDQTGKELPENKQTAGYILQLSAGDGFTTLNNEGALIDIYIANDDSNKPILYNKGTVNYIDKNYGIIDGLNIGKIDFRPKNYISADKGNNYGTIKNSLFNVTGKLSFYNYGEFSNDNQQSSIVLNTDARFHNENNGGIIKNYLINNNSLAYFYNNGEIFRSNIDNDGTIYNGDKDHTTDARGQIRSSIINNSKVFYNYGTINDSVINNDYEFQNYGDINANEINTSGHSSMSYFKNYGNLMAKEVNNDSSFQILGKSNGLSGYAHIERLNNEGSVYVKDGGTLSVVFGKNIDGNLYLEDGGNFQPIVYDDTTPTFINDSRSKIVVEEGGSFYDTTVENIGTFQNDGTTSVNQFNNHEGGTLITGFDNIFTKTNTVNNDGLVQFQGNGDININIRGGGEVELNGDVTNNSSIHQGKLTIKEGNTFSTYVGDKYVVGETVNDGKIDFIGGGNISGGYSGNGTMTLVTDDPMSLTDYTFIGKEQEKIQQKDITINSSVYATNKSVLEVSNCLIIGPNSIFDTYADTIISSGGKPISNWGTLNLLGGTNYNTIEDGGKTVIVGDSVRNEALIDQELEIDYNAKLTSELKNIGDKFTNKGTFELLGDLSGTILGNGKTILQDSIVKAADGSTIEGMLDMNGATLDMQDKEFSTINAGELEGSGDLKIDIAVGKDKNNSDKINITNVSNNAILNLTNIKITNSGDTSEDDRGNYENALTYVDGNANNGITYQIKGKTGSNAIYRALDRVNLYEFTLGDKGKLNVNIENNPLNLDDYINGSNSIITSVDAYNVLMDTELVSVTTGIAGYSPENKHWAVNLNNGSKISAKGNVNQNDGITITQDATFDLDGSHKAGASIENFKTAIINNGNLNINDIKFQNNTTDIENNALLNLSGTNDIKNIVGKGTTTINRGETKIDDITQDKLNVLSNAVLKFSNTNVLSGIVNEGKIQALGGTNNSVITGHGTLEIMGNFTNNASITQNNLTIDETGALTSAINNLHITNDILNNGTLELTDNGTLFNNINGSDNSQTKISGNIINNAIINQDVTITENGTLTSSFDGLNKSVTNNGIFNMQGDLKKDIKGNLGTTVLQDKNVNVINDEIEVAGNLDLNGKTLDMRDAKGTSQKLVVGGALKGSGNLKIDVNMSNSNSDMIELMSKDNDATLNLTAINITSDIENNSSFEDYINYVTGYTNGVNFQVDGNENGELTVLTNGMKYIFTKGADGYLNVLSQNHTGGLSEYIRGEISAENYSINDDMITLGNTDIGMTGGKNHIKRVFLNNGATLSGDLLNQNDGITVAKNYELILDGTSQEGATVKNYKTALTNNGTANVMGITFENNQTDIENNGRLNLSDNNTLDTISGNGILNINDGTTNVIKSIIQSEININSDTATLITNADGLKAYSINNDGTLELTGGTLSRVVNGGNISISGDVSTEADNLQGITNIKNTLNITGGSIKQEINSVLDSNLNITGNTALKSDLSGVLGNVTLQKGILKLSDKGTMFTNSQNFTAANNTTIDFNNGKSDDLNFNKVTIAEGGNVNLKIDFGDTFKTSDNSSILGNINLALLDVTKQTEDKTYNFTNLIDNVIVDFKNTELLRTPISVDFINYNSGDLIAKKVGNLGTAIKNAMTGENLYQLSGDDNTAEFNTLSGGNLTVKGQGHSITTTGIVVDNQNVLTLQDANIKNVATGSDNKAAITLNKGTVLNISATKHDVIIGGTNSDNNNAIYLDKDATLNINAQKSIIITDNITSNDKANTVNFNGNLIGFGGNLDNVTANINSVLVRDGADNGVSYNLNGGVLKYTNDKYLYDPSARVLNSINFNGGALDLRNGSANNIVLENINLSAPSNMFIDADLAKLSMDSLNAASVTGNQTLNIAGIRLLSDSKNGYTSINFTKNPTLMAAINYTGNKNLAYSSICRYLVNYDGSMGNFNFKRNGFNPSVLAAPVAAQVGSYLSQLNIYEQAFSNMDMVMLMTKKERQAMKMANKYANQGTGAGGIITFSPNQIPEQNKGVWFRPFTTFENVGLKNGPKVGNVAYGSLVGGDSEIIELKHGWDMTYSLYAGYTGSHQTYDGVGIYQNGGTLGASTAFYKGNFFTGLTANVGANIAEASTMYGSEDLTMLATGIASKTGYNFELADGKFIIQPNYLMSYTFVNTFDYTNKAGVRMNSDPLHAIQIAPGIKFIGNLKNGWQPYLGVQMVWNLLDDTRFMANNVSLPDLSVKPYVQYGIGVQKRWGERFTGFVQTMIRNGGRNGVALTAGFRWAIGK